MSALLTAVPEVETGVRYDPNGPEPDFLFEVVDGFIVRKTVGAAEVTLANLLNEFLIPVLKESGFGKSFVERGVELSRTGETRRPDLSIVSFERWPKGKRIPKGDFVPVAPDLAVEVISPHETSRSTTSKIRDYFQGGVRVVWVVYPNVEQVHCYTSPTEVRILTRNDTLTAEPLFTGFRLPLAELFPETNDEPIPAGTP
jgi:Uma2 family endonuclease